MDSRVRHRRPIRNDGRPPMQTICAIMLCGVLATVAQPGPGSANMARSNAAGPGAETDGELMSVYALAFHPEAGTLPQGAVYVCRARIMPGTNAGQAARGSGNDAGCALEVPFVWQANRPQPAATLSYEVDVVSAGG